jgi:hypothetical protein
VKKEQAAEIFRPHANAMLFREVVEGDGDQPRGYFDCQLLKTIAGGQRVCVEWPKHRGGKNELINRFSRTDWLRQRQAILRQAVEKAFYMIQGGLVSRWIKLIECMQDLKTQFSVSAMCGSRGESLRTKLNTAESSMTRCPYSILSLEAIGYKCAPNVKRQSG